MWSNSLQERARTRGSRRPSRKNAVGLRREPRVRARSCKEFDHIAIHGMVVERLAAAFAEKHRNRHAPHTLARDTPVGASLNHVREAFFAPRRIPLHALD